MKLILLLALSVASQSTESPKPEECPMHADHTQVKARAEKGMGFSQTAATHHFLLNESGGTIQVEANNSTDVTNRDDIRMHLRHIAHAFQTGDFDIPMFVHDTVPPGVQEMKRAQKHIRYVFEETPSGGRVVISTTDKHALNAIHRFLRFQIEEHKTGDPARDH